MSDADLALERIRLLLVKWHELPKRYRDHVVSVLHLDRHRDVSELNRLSKKVASLSQGLALAELRNQINAMSTAIRVLESPLLLSDVLALLSKPLREN